MHDQLEFDVLIIGSGAAGLSLALKLADRSNVAVLSKNALVDLPRHFKSHQNRIVFSKKEVSRTP